MNVLAQTVTGIPVRQYPKEMGKHVVHPLAALFAARGFTHRQGMDWLQERGHVSDECVWLEDVAPADVERILYAARFECYLQAVERFAPREDATPSG